jgi:hypothetical protein
MNTPHINKRVGILVWNGPNGDQYWLADTPARRDAAMKALFTLMDEMGYYADGEVSQRWLDAARAGDMPYIRAVLDSRRRHEYESWDMETAEIVE